MEYIGQEADSADSEKKYSSKFGFLHKKGFKSAALLLILLTFLSIVYTLVNKVSSPNLNQLFQKLFSEMKEGISNSTMMKNIL